MQLASVDDQQKLQQIKQVLEGHPGTAPAVVVFGESTNKRAIRLPFGVTISDSVTTKLQDLLGNECVVAR